MSIIQVINENAYEHRKAIAEAWADSDGSFEVFRAELAAHQHDDPELPVDAILSKLESLLAEM